MILGIVHLTIFFDGKMRTLSAGGKITFPKNKLHNHFKNDDIPAEYIHSVAPALHRPGGKLCCNTSFILP